MVRVLGGALEAAGEAEEVVVEAVGRGGGGREMAILGDSGDGFVDVVVVEVAAEVEGRGRRHSAAETPKGRGDGTESRERWGRGEWVLFLLSFSPCGGGTGRRSRSSSDRVVCVCVYEEGRKGRRGILDGERPRPFQISNSNGTERIRNRNGTNHKSRVIGN